MRAGCWLPLMSILVVTHRVSPTRPAAGGAVLMQAARPQRQELSPGSLVLPHPPELSPDCKPQKRGSGISVVKSTFSGDDSVELSLHLGGISAAAAHPPAADPCADRGSSLSLGKREQEENRAECQGQRHSRE